MEPSFSNIDNLLKVFGLSAFSFVLAILFTPVLTHYMYKYKLWRREVRTTSPDGSLTPLFTKLHQEREIGVPRLGGVLIWLTTIVVSLLFWIISQISNVPFWDKINFLSRNQTWLPLFIMLAASLLGLADDLFQIFKKGGPASGGIRFKHRLCAVFVIAFLGAWWFYIKLGWMTMYIPGLGDMFIGVWYIPLFVITMILLFSSSIVDGIDGLAGGIFASIFAAYGGIAFFMGQIDIAAFAGVVLGALLAFLWFNIPPARFYMGESGILGLTTSLTVIAFLTDSIFVLPIIGIILMAEVASNLIQFASKRFLGRKVFLIAPLHHHFEALGWPSHKVTMRFWVISFVAAIIGIAAALIGR